MKNIVLVGLILIAFTARAQTLSDLENFNLGTNTFWNGNTEPMGTTFQSGNIIYRNNYDTAFGGYWASGWSYSTMQDDTNTGFANLYSAITASGHESSTYAVGQQDARIILDSAARGGVVEGFYVTNSTYAAISMRDGDFFGKMFGDSLDANGNNDGTNGEDYFKLTVQGWYEGSVIQDSVEFYLADYRFTDNAQDYIITEWEWVDLTSLGNVDSLWFTLRSSDIGFFGMNTPAFFCIDDMETRDAAKIDTITTTVDGDTIYIVGNDTYEIFDGSFVPLTTEDLSKSDISFYPNPTSGLINVTGLPDQAFIRLYNMQGQMILTKPNISQPQSIVDLSIIENGVYVMEIETSDGHFKTGLIIKE